MSDYDRYANARSGAGFARSGVAVDQGLRAYMIGVYNYMTLGLGVTGLVAYAAFASLSLYGYTTQRSLSAMGSFMMMGVVGLIVASLLNVFLLHSTGLQFGLSILCVLIFAGLTAWDTQSIKEMYLSSDSYEMAQKKSIHGALRLYLDFINMFQAILMLTGSQRNN